MTEPTLETTLTAAALVGADLVPSLFNVSGVSVRYLTYFEALYRIVEAFERDQASFIGLYVPFTRSGIRERFPNLTSVKVQWDDGPRHGGAYYYTEKLSLGESVLPGYMVLEDNVVHKGDASAKASFFSYWKNNCSFNTIGSPGNVLPADVVAGKVWAGLESIKVFYLHKGVEPVRYGEDRWRSHPEPEPYWSDFEIKAGSSKEFSQLFEIGN